MSYIAPEIEDKLKPELNTGEKLLWADIPKQGIVFRLIDIYLIPFSFFWLYMVVKNMEVPSDPGIILFMTVFFPSVCFLQ